MSDLVLGSAVDTTTHERTSEPAVVPSGDLVTHGVIVGMTGSGKTGLGVVLVEECLSAGVPTILFDPKGDLTNLCLILPQLDRGSFEPWVDPGAAAKAGLDVGDFAEAQATTWRDGLSSWQITAERLAGLRESVDFAVYTPGSSAGVPVNILGSLDAPPAGADLEALQDEIAGYASSLLGLVGVDADPLTSREHILVSTILHQAWVAGESLDLPTLIMRVSAPPFRKLGVFDLDQFFPAKERTELALRLNGLLASPGFAAWLEGDPLDVESLLWAPDGRPRCSVITVAHLSDDERQAVTAVVLSKVITWMRSQSGTTDLRALLYLDEVAGYLPPVGNPPTKQPLLLLMKQARAFGVGVVLSTQNPVDIDYKALSNAGTWMIGRLQTEQDKARLLDGLTAAAGGVNRSDVDHAIGGLGSREFLLRHPGSDEPSTMTTRWAMSYLRGPLTREQIAALKARGFLTPGGIRSVAGTPEPSSPTVTAEDDGAHAASPPTTDLADDETVVMPPVADRVPVAYLDPAAAWASGIGAARGQRLQAIAVARVHLRYDETRADLVHDEEYEAVIHPLPVDADLVVTQVDYDDRDFSGTVPSGARYVLPEADVASAAWWTSLRRALTDHLVRNRALEVLVNRDLRVYSRPGESQDEFAERCRAAADVAADEATAALRDKAEKKVRTLQSRLLAAQHKVAAAEDARNAQIGTEVASTVGSLLGGVFGGRRSRASVASAARRAQSAQSRVDAARQKVDDVSEQIALIEADLADEIVELDDRWAEKAGRIETLPVSLERTDVRIADLRLVWACLSPPEAGSPT